MQADTQEETLQPESSEIEDTSPKQVNTQEDERRWMKYTGYRRKMHSPEQ